MSSRLRRVARRIRDRLLYREIGLAELEGILDDLGVRDERMIVVYSSWRDLRLRARPSEVVDLLLRRLSASGVLAFPTAPFRWRLESYLARRPTFDVQRTPSYRGLLSEVARRRPDAHRTRQPAAPYSLIGQGAEELARAHVDLTSGYSPDSFLAETVRQDALILMLGVPWNLNTLVHFVEKQMDDRLGSFSTELLPYHLKDGDTEIEAASEYLRQCVRDRTFMLSLFREQDSFLQLRPHRVPYSRVRTLDAFEVYATSIEEGRIRLKE